MLELILNTYRAAWGDYRPHGIRHTSGVEWHGYLAGATSLVAIAGEEYIFYWDELPPPAIVSRMMRRLA